MKRLKLFAKGNVDVHDSLHSSRVGGELLWNGVNEVLRAQFPGTLIRLQHETFAGSRVLLSLQGQPPQTLRDLDPHLGVYPTAQQYSAAIFSTDADAIVLSIMPDVSMEPLRHRASGTLIYVDPAVERGPETLRVLKEDFEPCPAFGPEQFAESMRRLIARIRLGCDCPILIYNMSPADPGPLIHCYQGFDDDFGTRVRRFNLELVEISRDTGISIVDVDGVVAMGGVERLKLDMIHLTAEGNRRVAEEVVRILEELGLLAD